MKANFIFLVLFFMINTHNFLHAQAIAPVIDPTPLELPKPLMVIPTDTPSSLLKIITDTLKVYKYQITRSDFKEYIIEAKRNIKSNSQDYDKIIIWLERDFNEPLKFIKLYFIHGRYLKIVSQKTSIERIYINASQEDAYVGKLKKALIAISTHLWGGYEYK